MDIFQNPTNQEYITASAGSQLRIRYDASSSHYQVMLPGGDWTALVDDPSSFFNGAASMSFKLAGSPQSIFIIRTHYSLPADIRYRYSNLAVWGIATTDGKGSAAGTTAFGIPTTVAGIPLSGSATYQGMIEGGATFKCVCGWDGEIANAGIGGTVSFNFDFGKGSFSGTLNPYLDAEKRYDLDALTFSNTSFGAGSQIFSGTFNTNVSGPNSFAGQFTGPHAEELIGKWEFPFSSPTDGSAQSASGAMIAKQ